MLFRSGKTGTSRDGWFAGFTSKLITVVWVGFDDNRDFKLQGAYSALPIWTEFMKRAHKRRGYRSVHEFEAPEGIITADIDAETGLLATPGCTKVVSEVFIAGTQPLEACPLHGGGGRTQVAGWEPSKEAAKEGDKAEVAASVPLSPIQRPTPQTAARAQQPAAAATKPAEPETKPAKGFFRRLKDIFR